MQYGKIRSNATPTTTAATGTTTTATSTTTTATTTMNMEMSYSRTRGGLAWERTVLKCNNKTLGGNSQNFLMQI